MEALEALIAGTTWFARCGSFIGDPDAIPLSAVASTDAWDWLPTAHDQPDPIHEQALITEAEAVGLGTVRRDAELAAVRWVLVGLRGVSESVPALVDGPYDFTSAARGGAEFAARVAAREAVVGRPGFWWQVLRLFAAGYWPCGRVRGEGPLVVL